MTDKYMSRIGSSIKAYRKALGMTQKELAEAIGKSTRTIQGYENGTIDLSLSTLEKIADALKIDVTNISKGGFHDKVEHKFVFFFEFDEKEKQMGNELMKHFNKLNETGQNEAIKRTSELTEIEKYRKV